MVYSVKNTRNTEIDTIADNTLKTSTYGTQIPGKNYSGFGEAIAQTLTHIVENFAAPNSGSNTPNPSNPNVNLTAPLTGQLWYDTTNDKLRSFDGTNWNIASGAAVASASPPSGPLAGDLWFNTTTDQLFAYDGTNWLLIGPLSDQTDLVFTRAIKVYHGAGATGGAGSGDAAAPTGGTATDALGIFIGNTLTGIWCGTQILTNLAYYYIELNDGSSNVRYYSFTPYGTVIEVGLNIESGASDYFNGRAKVADTADAISGVTSSNLMRNDNGAGASTSRLPTTGSLDIGSSGSRWGVMYATTFNGTATAAQYADLAERYEIDSPATAGTIVKLGGSKEVTQTSESFDDDVFGIVSVNPAFRMNEGAGDDLSHPFIAFSGRVPVKVIGSVNKGDRLVSSNTPGYAMAVSKQEAKDNFFAVIGRALEDKTDQDPGTIEAVVGAK